MKLRRFQLIGVAVLIATLLVIWFAPLLIANGVRTWLWWAGRSEGLLVEVADVEAPLLRPVVLHGLRIRTQPNAQLAVDVALARAEVGLNLAAVLRPAMGRRLRDVSIDGARVTIGKRASQPAENSAIDWSTLQNLFADTLHVSHLDFRIENGSTVFDGRDASFTASEVQTGALTIAEIAVASPLVSKRFANLRGATSWQNQRLTLGAITLARGIDIDAITADFSHVALQRIGVEMSVDVFGGKFRANVTTDHRRGRHFWDVAGTASKISLAQMAETLGWRAPATGAVRMCKFTFRGDAAAVKKSTASIWAEVNDLAWGGRAAQTIMLGASIYSQRLHLEQLYVKQEKNQLTLSADAPLTFSAEDWAKPDLNAEFSASIHDLDALAQLFGARPGEYGGSIELNGAFGVEDHLARGNLGASGEIQLSDARALSASTVTARVLCDGSSATVADAIFKRGDDHLAGRGAIEFNDLREITARFYPSTPTTDVTALPSGSCVSSLALVPAEAGRLESSSLSEIQVRGGLLTGEWTVSVVNEIGDARTARTFTLCPAARPGGELRLVGTRPQ